jgi:hypothetical protein
MAGTARLVLFLLIVIFMSAPVSAQDLPQNATTEANAFLDVFFKHKETFIDDIRIDEIQIKNRKNIRAVAVEPIDPIPIHTAILLDISGSQVNHVKEIRRLYEGIIQALPLRSADTARVIYFNQDIRALLNETSSRDLLLKGSDNIRFMGGSAIYDAIYYACRTLADYPESRKSMIILSDGEDHDSSYSIDDTYREAIANNIRVYMFVMEEDEWKDERRDIFFRRRSKGYEKHEKHIEKTGGKVVLVSDSESGRKQVEEIIDEWNHIRRICFSVDTSGKPASGLKISVTRKGVKAYHSSTPQFIAGKSGAIDPGR